MAIYRDGKALKSAYANSTEIAAMYYATKRSSDSAKLIYLKYYPNGYHSKTVSDQITPEEWSALRSSDIIAESGYPFYVSSAKTIYLDRTEVDKIYRDYYFSVSPECTQFGSASCSKLIDILTAAKNGNNDLNKRMIVYPNTNNRGIAALYIHGHFKMIRMNYISSENKWQCSDLQNNCYIQFFKNPQY
ncbi:hypothetical protein GCM10022297_01000 [Lactobacillus hamsteri]|uniref:Uncharacterized protein n=1 Tax=Lactobacillus hamsteri DSM 5661 = JCM 6256 TaxID=1423754 RepID=A0A0R1Y3T5_9LACO|nr:hypothetical protein [Lactobacillus hamsteri]KRM36990.1 hypothetical protein FC39_GL000442 [Lactobacillus hamsteri DSM 5661 = JCM 6256]